ncbi:MAG TPA: cation:proton antiporter [Dehalococcoidia bacterium]|nr:cation:proton antiporter [Dehalococcoidia bacterium]
MEIAIYFKFILSFGLILLAARVGGELFERYLKQPPVLGELVAGIIISPFALGGLINDPIILNFATVHHAFGLHEFSVMEIIAEIAVVALLFVAGIETDVRAFLRQGLVGALVAVGGVIFPFIFGFLITMWLVPDAAIAGWMFMGATLTATSIGVTVRILMEMGKLQTKAGTTVLVGAVIDDIIGIVVLSIVIGVAATAKAGGDISLGHVCLDALKIAVIGFAVWFALLIIGVRFSKYISWFLLSPFRRSGTIPIFAIIIGFIIAYLVTLVGLHPVVGAYVAGLMFAATNEREDILDRTRPIMLFLAPFFFCYLGMQVDTRLLWGGAIVALILIIAAVIGKVMGCYIPARFAGKMSHTESMIVGIGMVPRGEVGLIIAGAGLLAGAIGRELFGAAVAVSVVTTLVTPAMLKPFFSRQPVSPVEEDEGERQGE